MLLSFCTTKMVPLVYLRSIVIFDLEFHQVEGSKQQYGFGNKAE